MCLRLKWAMNWRQLSLSLLVFYVTCNDISVMHVYVDGTDVQADIRSCTYGRAPNAIYIS